MPKKKRALKLTSGRGYAELVKKIKSEFSTLETLFRQLSAKCYWKVGEYVHKHILQNKDRAGYGKYIYDLLADELGREKSTLQRSVQFYLTYPAIIGGRQQLSWTHYRKLITVKDKDERKKLEAQIIQKGWNAEKLQDYLNFKKSQLVAEEDPDKPITQLAFKRGVLSTYGVVENPEQEGEFFIDLGFRFRKSLENFKSLKLAKADFLRLDDADNSLSRVTSTRGEIFTYKASVEKVIDGDTINTLIELGFGLFVQQKLRLRGIDCPEVDTEEGQRAKKFVQSRLSTCDFIIVKTYKDSTDKYDRYLADIFYAHDETDADKVAEQGHYLNQELLDERLACAY